VKAQLVAAIERNHQAYRQKAPRVPRKSGSRPDFSPRVASDKVLEFFIGCVFGRFGAIYVCIAKYASTYAHSRFVAFALIHCRVPFLKIVSLMLE